MTAPPQRWFDNMNGYRQGPGNAIIGPREGRHCRDVPAVETCPRCGGAALGCLCPVVEYPGRHKGPPPDHAD
jgi:hypothetical protein